ncbi:MAG: NTP transferase domain-containing protein [Steroidobacteraceae bacterium]
MSAALYGLVLTGGRSQRMRRDKAALEYAGQTQLARAMNLIRPLVARSFISLRNDQLDDPQRAGYERIVDRLGDMGPIGGIHAAQAEHPEAAWLVLACDLPFLDAATLQQLLAARAPGRLATAFLSSFDGKPEPLCAIYEPASRAPLEQWIAAGKSCPRAFLTQHDTELLQLANAHALDNINTSEEYLQARASLQPQPAGAAGPLLAVRVQYFAVLREQAGRSEEQLQTRARTPKELYAELREVRGLKLAPELLRVAINDRFGNWEQDLKSGDAVVFLPPVAGG